MNVALSMRPSLVCLYIFSSKCQHINPLFECTAFYYIRFVCKRIRALERIHERNGTTAMAKSLKPKYGEGAKKKKSIKYFIPCISSTAAFFHFESVCLRTLCLLFHLQRWYIIRYSPQPFMILGSFCCIHITLALVSHWIEKNTHTNTQNRGE